MGSSHNRALYKCTSTLTLSVDVLYNKALQKSSLLYLIFYSMHVKLQVSLCSSYDLCHPV